MVVTHAAIKDTEIASQGAASRRVFSFKLKNIIVNCHTLSVSTTFIKDFMTIDALNSPRHHHL